jgi:hypothetical protein
VLFCSPRVGPKRVGGRCNPIATKFPQVRTGWFPADKSSPYTNQCQDSDFAITHAPKSITSKQLSVPKILKWVTKFKSHANLLLEQLSSTLDACESFQSAKSFFEDTTTAGAWLAAIDIELNDLVHLKKEIELLVSRSERVSANVRLHSYNLFEKTVSFGLSTKTQLQLRQATTLDSSFGLHQTQLAAALEDRERRIPTSLMLVSKSL